MIKEESLGELGFIRSGYNYRTAQELAPGNDANYQALQVNAITDDARLNWDNLTPLRFDGNAEQYSLRSGDVLFPLRGSRTLAVEVFDPPKNVLAIGHWAIFTPDRERVDSTYLVWYWNHPDICKRRGYELSKGSNIQFISMQDCKKFKVTLPTLGKQQQIAKIAELRMQERELVKKIEVLKDNLIDTVMMQLITNK